MHTNIYTVHSGAAQKNPLNQGCYGGGMKKAWEQVYMFVYN
jgi:hypothetical protein